MKKFTITFKDSDHVHEVEAPSLGYAERLAYHYGEWKGMKVKAICESQS